MKPHLFRCFTDSVAVSAHVTLCLSCFDAIEQLFIVKSAGRCSVGDRENNGLAVD